MKVAVFPLLVGLVVTTGCHHGGTPETVDDFSGLSTDQSATSDEGGEPDDGGVVDGGVACDPGAILDGGSAVGSWTVRGACATGEAFYQLTATCAGTTYDTLAVTTGAGGPPTGTLALFEAGTYTRELTAQLSAHALVPHACATTGCSAFATTTHEQFGWLTIACAPQGDDCLCPISADISVALESGDWAPTAEGFTLQTTSGQAQSFVSGVSADHATLVVRGDDTSLRGARGVTLVLDR